MTMKRISRGRQLTPEEAARYQQIREQIDSELPELVERHHERMAILDQFQHLFTQLRAAREAEGMSLADLADITGMDPATLAHLEMGQRFNPTLEILARYAEAIGKRLVVTLADAESLPPST